MTDSQKSTAATLPGTSAPRPEYYADVTFSPSNEDRQYLVFKATAGAPKLPEEMVAFRRDCVSTARTIVLLFRDEINIRNDLFQRLHAAADRGLLRASYDLADGRDNLDEVREHIADLALQIRDTRLLQYSLLALFAGVLPLLVGAVIMQTKAFGMLPDPAPADKPIYSPLFAWIVAAFWIPAGAAVCLWGEFALRMQAGVSYEQLREMDPGRWRPHQRLLITVGIAFILAFVLAFKIVQVGLSSVLLNDFADKAPGLSLAVGGITALAFTAVRDIIFKITPAEKR